MLAPSLPALVKVPARHLMRGDVTGSGETILSVSVGARTPRGKVEIVLEKGDRKRRALWGASTAIGVRRAPPAAPVSPDDRLPTVAEVTGFDAVAAWDRLTPEQQRKVGVLAVELALVGGSTKFDLGWTLEQIDDMACRGDNLLQAFFEATEPLWADFYGWRAQ